MTEADYLLETLGFKKRVASNGLFYENGDIIIEFSGETVQIFDVVNYDSVAIKPDVYHAIAFKLTELGWF